jgi:hypothetical protein
MKWILFERGSNDREVFEVKKFAALTKVEAGQFTWNKAEFPGFKAVDLR